MVSQTQEIGFNTFRKEFKVSPKEVMECLPCNEGRHTLIKLWDGIKIILISKNAPFRNFGHIFGTNEGYGESINQEVLNRYIKLGINFLVFRYLDSGYTYFIRPPQFYNNCWIRTVDKADKRKRYGVVVKVREVTISTPMKELRRMESLKQLRLLVAKDK